MSEQVRPSHALHDSSSGEPAGFSFLAELALDMRWAWNHATDKVWRQLDPELWEATKNPWIVLNAASRQQVAQLFVDADFCRLVDDLVQAKRRRAEAPAWFQHICPQAELKTVAYFCMEFMLSEALPIYSGGLGNVAGDLLKSASDMGVPIVGVGLLYQQGYFHQQIDRSGEQMAILPYNEPGLLPITPVRNGDGEWLRLQLNLPGHPIWLRAWQVQIGKGKLYLLDSNDPSNYPLYRGITSELYGGGPTMRLMQELVLGIGGWQLLTELGIEPEVCHMNEGHAAFAVLERARNYMQATGQPFDVALAVTRAGNVFTTHTAVEAGFDRYSPLQIAHCLGGYAHRNLGISLDELLALGRHNPDDQAEDFNMAYLAIRGSGAVNGVSRLHGKVSRQLFAPLFPRWPAVEMPIGHVTNGVHMSTWDSAEADALWTEVNGKERWLGTTEKLEQNMQRVSDETFWRFRCASRVSLVNYARERLSRQLASSGSSPEMVEAVNHLFDPNVLTLGFARRFAAYKRPNLLLHDPERLLRLLNDPERPLQIIIAGKAHPDDAAGKALIRQWIDFIRRPEARQRIIFLSDYDMHLSEHLVQGVDVWLNTPRRPWEACGTSGMKVLVNGGINLSVLDGWWAEAYAPEVGWAIGDGKEHVDHALWDASDAAQLYDLLEHDVVPEFYARNDQGLPTAWVARMRESMAHLTPQYSTCRSLREYVKQYYLPATENYRRRAADGGVYGQELVAWWHRLRQAWPSLRFGQSAVETANAQHLFEVQVYLGELEPSMVRIELYADAVGGGEPLRQEMQCVRQLVGAVNGYAYQAGVPSSRPVTDFTARLMPRDDGIAIPLESGLILWQR
ncbi:MAG: alpha-glucan phosphorylase [Burkholderiaceae bacterium]|nr:alpha-glucan phosphorylase [Burkholderiaceae bacterium]